MRLRAASEARPAILVSLAARLESSAPLVARTIDREGTTRMGDAGEGLIDADSRIQERMEELARERAEKRSAVVIDPEAARELESLRLARTELERQLEATTHDRRRAQLVQALAELDKRLTDAQKRASK